MVTVTQRWTSLYSDSKSVSGVTTCVHLGGMLLAGGFAIATDRLTLRAFEKGPLARMRQLAEIHAVHRPVLIGLALTFASGTLMFLADIKALASSPVFWVKGGVVVLLLLNGAVMQRAESRLQLGAGSAERRYWRQLRVTSLASLALWFAALAAGTLLTAFA
jgi:hypothetical protein